MLLDTPSQFIPSFLEDFLGAAGREYRDQSIGDLLSNVVSGISSKIRVEVRFIFLLSCMFICVSILVLRSSIS